MLNKKITSLNNGYFYNFRNRVI